MVAIRESIRLDSALGRALVSILMVSAQMEFEATGKRTREAISHIRRCGYHFGKTPYGFKTDPSSDNPRFRVIAEDEAEQRTLIQSSVLLNTGAAFQESQPFFNHDYFNPPQGSI